jgi:hypothetical protein
MIRIKKRRADDGYFFEIDDVQAYIEALRAQGIEPPRTRYCVFISFEHERGLGALPDWERQIETFYQLGATTQIPCEIVSA